MALEYQIALANKTSHMKVTPVHLDGGNNYYKKQDIGYEWNYADTAGCKSTSWPLYLTHE